jgi:hypothetical protein
MAYLSSSSGCNEIETSFFLALRQISCLLEFQSVLYNLLLGLLTPKGTANCKCNVAELIIFASPRTKLCHLYIMLDARCLAATNLMYEQVGPGVACMQTCSSH